MRLTRRVLAGGATGLSVAAGAVLAFSAVGGPGIGSASALREVSADEAATLYGGSYCGKAASEGNTCEGTYKGCVETTGDALTSANGSWKQDGADVYCGVQECGKVIKTKACDS